MEEVESFKYLAGKFEWVKGYEQFLISVVTSLHQQLHRTEATFSALQETIMYITEELQ